MSSPNSNPTGHDRDRGSAELAVATPLMLLLLALTVLIAQWAHATHIAQTIAQHGHATARALDATDAEGHARADEVADQLSGDLLQDLTITVERGATTTIVQVSAHVPTMIRVNLPVHAQVSGPTEHHTPTGGGPP